MTNSADPDQLASSSIIDHVYTSNPEYITESFVPHYAISDHFPVCFTRKVMSKISKNKHITTTYRCYKTFDENLFLTNLTRGLEHFEVTFKYAETFTTKKWKFSDKNSDIFHVSAQNVDCGCPLEPPRQGGSNEYLQSMFWAEIRKIMYTPVNPSFTI